MGDLCAKPYRRGKAGNKLSMQSIIILLYQINLMLYKNIFAIFLFLTVVLINCCYSLELGNLPSIDKCKTDDSLFTFLNNALANAQTVQERAWALGSLAECSRAKGRYEEAYQYAHDATMLVKDYHLEGFYNDAERSLLWASIPLIYQYRSSGDIVKSNYYAITTYKLLCLEWEYQNEGVDCTILSYELAKNALYNRDFEYLPVLENRITQTTNESQLILLYASIYLAKAEELAQAKNFPQAISYANQSAYYYLEVEKAQIIGKPGVANLSSQYALHRINYFYFLDTGDERYKNKYILESPDIREQLDTYGLYSLANLELKQKLELQPFTELSYSEKLSTLKLANYYSLSYPDNISEGDDVSISFSAKVQNWVPVNVPRLKYCCNQFCSNYYFFTENKEVNVTIDLNNVTENVSCQIEVFSETNPQVPIDTVTSLFPEAVQLCSEIFGQTLDCVWWDKKPEINIEVVPKPKPLISIVLDTYRDLQEYWGIFLVLITVLGLFLFSKNRADLQKKISPWTNKFLSFLKTKPQSIKDKEKENADAGI